MNHHPFASLARLCLACSRSIPAIFARAFSLAGNVMLFAVVPGVVAWTTVPTASAQTVEQVLILKTSDWVQTSASDPIVDPRNPGPGYSGAYNFGVSVDGTNIAGIAAPTVTLPAGSLYPTQNPARHNAGVLAYAAGDQIWRYGSDAGGWGGSTEASRDAAFAFGTYGLKVLGETFNLNFPTATAFPINTPKLILSGGAWVGGKYVVDPTKPLTITTNAFTNFSKNADGVIEFYFVDDADDLADEVVFYSNHPTGPNFLTINIPANTLVAGRDYEGRVTFYAVMDKRGSSATRLDAAAYARTTTFTLSAATPAPANAQATLYGIGDLVGGISFSEVRDATKSGGVIYGVGDSVAYNGSTGGDVGILWTSTNGLAPLPDIVSNLTATSSIAAPAITPDGTFIASRARFGTGGGQRHAVRVTSNGLTNLDLGILPGFTFSQTSTISNDGSVLYGVATYATGRNRAVRFGTNPAAVTPISFLNAGDDASTPADRGASADGSVMVGRSTNTAVDDSGASPGGGGFGLGNQAFRYVHGSPGVVSAIPFFAGGTWNGAVAVSPSGNLTLVRGDSSSAPQGEFFLHNASAGTLTSYGTPNGSRRPGGIVGMTSDGAVVATSFNAADNPTNQTVIRNAQGWHDFQSMVERANVNLTGWNLRDQTLFGISPDGTLVWGRGTHNGDREGFIVEFPPGYLAAYNERPIASTPGAAIVGAWWSGSEATDNSVIVFFSNGYYMHLQIASASENPTGVSGFERGTYTWDATTGAITFATLVDTNGDIGLSGAAGEAGIVATIANNTITFASPGGGFSATRLTGASPIVGAFGDATSSDNASVYIFMPTGAYYMARDGNFAPGTGDTTGRDGVERGTYTWNAQTGSLTTTVLQDTNGQWGFSHSPAGAKTATVSADLKTVTFSAALGGATLARVAPAATPVVTTPPLNHAPTPGGNVTVNVGLVPSPGQTVEWSRNGTVIGGAADGSLSITDVHSANTGLYTAAITNPAGTLVSTPAIVGLNATVKVSDAGGEVGSNIVHPNGNIFDQVLPSGAAVSIKADPGQITRTSFLDLSNDIVQVEFSGAGTLSLVLDNVSGPALPSKYNQDVAYMKGHVGIVITGANETTHVGVFSVGRITAVNQALFKDGVTYDGFADIAFIAISSTDGKFGGLRAANASFFAAQGMTGIWAPGVQFTGPVFVGDISAFATATPAMVLGAAADTRITGGDMFQTNGKPVLVSGITQLKFVPGSDSHGTQLPAQQNRARYVDLNGVDVTDQIVANPTP